MCGKVNLCGILEHIIEGEIYASRRRKELGGEETIEKQWKRMRRKDGETTGGDTEC